MPGLKLNMLVKGGQSVWILTDTTSKDQLALRIQMKTGHLTYRLPYDLMLALISRNIPIHISNYFVHFHYEMFSFNGLYSHVMLFFHNEFQWRETKELCFIPRIVTHHIIFISCICSVYLRLVTMNIVLIRTNLCRRTILFENYNTSNYH